MSKIISTLNHFLTNITEHIEFIEEKSSDEANVVFKNENMIWYFWNALYDGLKLWLDSSFPYVITNMMIELLIE